MPRNFTPAPEHQKVILSGGTFNAISSVVQDAQSRGASFSTPGGIVAQNHTMLWGWVRNDTGSTLSRFEIAGVDVPVVTQADNDTEFWDNWAFSVVTPVAGTHEGSFVVMLEETVNGEFGRALFGGMTPVLVDGAGDYAEIANGTTSSLAGGTSGSARVKWRASGAGEQWAICHINWGHFTPEFPAEYDTISHSVGDGETADTTSWDVADGRGLKMTRLTRVDYYDAGNETLYGYERTVLIDEYGHKVSETGETRVVIDTPVECS